MVDERHDEASVVTSNTCPFCAIILGDDSQARVVTKSEHVTAFFPINPATKGHTLVVPNRHVADVADLTAEESREIGEGVRRLARAIRSGLSPEGLNIIQSTGAVATQTVPHVHFHLVPRWSGDRMDLEWPDGPAEGDKEQDRTLELLKASVETAELPSSPEDRRQHLSFIQAVITRMSQASSSSKAWLLPIVTLTYGYAVTGRSVAVALIGCLAVLVFGTLDANYLKQERAFRKLYDEVSSGRAIPAFSMNPSLASPEGRNSNYWPDWREVRSWAVAPVYGPLLVVGLGIIIWLLWTR